MTTDSITLAPGLNAYQHVFWIATRSAIRQTAAAIISTTNNPLGGNEREQNAVAVAQSLAEFEAFLVRGLEGATSHVQDAPSFPDMILIVDGAFEFKSTPKMVFPSRN